MAGDKVDIFGRSYHTNYSSVSNSNSTPLSILQIMSGLISSPSNAISRKGVSASQLESWNSGLVPSSFIRGQNYESGTTIPKAYINYIFLDEQFRYVGGGASRVGNYGEVKQHWSELSNLAAQKNGYLLVYVSNESNFTVFFDNLQVVHKPGPIVEETHYYPFGLVMNGISSKGLNGTADNKLKFNGKEEQRKEFYDGSGLDWLDFGARMYDNQIGRWNIVDPLADHPNQVDKSSYSAFWNNPITYDDPDGKCPLCPWLDAVIDVGFVLYDVGVLVQEKVTTGKTSSVNWAALGADGASILVPMSVGAGAAVRAGVKAINKADNVVDAGNSMQKLKKSAETGQEAHRQIQKEIKIADPGAQIEKKVELKDKTVRKDAVKSDGTAVIIKPNTPSGQKSAKARENLMEKNGHKTETILYDPNNPAYQKGSPTYIGPKKKN